jgi:uncharacterized protein (TIGR02246 family)
MRRTASFALALVVFAVYAQAQPGKNPDVQKIADAFVTAWSKADAKALAALHADDAIRTNPQGQTIVGRAAIEQAFAAAFAGELKGSRLVIKPGDERSIGADVVVASGTWEITGGTPPAGAATRGTYLNTMVRQGGRWVIASSAPIPAPMKP